MAPHPLHTSGVLSQLYFTWVTPLLKNGGEQKAEEQLEMGGLDRAEVMHARLVDRLSRYAGQRNALFKAILMSVGPAYYLAGMGRVGWLAAIVGQIKCLGALVRAVHDEDDAWVIVLLALAMGVLSLIQSACMSAVFFGSARGGIRAKGGVSLLLMNKATTVSLGASTTGQSAVTLANNDTHRLQDGMRYSHFLWSAALEVVVITGLLIADVGLMPAAVGCLIIAFVIPVQLSLAKLEGKNHRRAATETDTRANLMKEILSSILFIKLSAYESPFTDRVSAVREKEVGYLRKSEILRAFNLSLFQAAPLVATFATFALYTLVADNDLNADLAFTSLSLFNTLMRTLIMVPRSATALSEMLVSCRRIMVYLALPDSPTTVTSMPASPSEPAVSVDKASFSWTTGAAVEGRPSTVLHDIQLNVGAGELVAVVGPSGGGKTSLLLALCGELFANGRVVVRGDVALSPQRPKLLQATLRANVQFHLPYNRAVLQTCLDAAQLTDDLDDVTAFPDGDLTDIGEGGVTLSGGQQARVSVARAFYRAAMGSPAAVLLLDDPLSALDSRVGRHLFNAVADMKGQTRIMVTHSAAVLPLCDTVVVVEAGRIVAHGPYAELVARGVNLHTREDEGQDGKEEVGEGKRGAVEDGERQGVGSGGEEEAKYDAHDKLVGHDPPSVSASASEPLVEEDTAGEEDEEAEEEKAADGVDSAVKASDVRLSAALASTPFPRKLVAAEAQAQGGIKGDVYRTYIRAAGGWCVVVMLLLLFVLSQAARIWTDTVVALWADDSLDASNTSYAWLYAGSTLAFVLLVFLRTATFTLTLLRASRRLHDLVLSSIMLAPIRFFWRTKSSSILNKTGRDCDNLDRLLVKSSNDLMSFSFIAMGALITIVVLVPWLAPVELVLLYFMYRVTKFWLTPARALKRLEGVTRSPLYDLMGQALSALLSVRAFGVRPVLRAKFEAALNTNQSTILTYEAAQRWLSVRLDLASGVVLAGIGILAASGDFSASLVGLALTQALQTSGVLQFAVRQGGEANSLFTSVERLLELQMAEKEADTGGDAPDGWPSQGVIRFDGVGLRYAEDLEPALTDVSFATAANEHVGILGRSGSGKTSTMMALLRMVPHTGTISIDGVDTRTLKLSALRRAVSVIPQTPDLFSGTVRFNLDPWGQHADDALKAALTAAHVDLSLDTDVSAGGGNLSAGERQLVCLARSRLQSNRIVFVDEATSSVDGRTDHRVQAALAAHDGTLLAIAHRLQTITRCSRLLVLNPGGTVAEFGSADDLRQQQGLFAAFEAQSKA